MAMIKSKKHTGVYYNLLEDGDKSYYFNYKDLNDVTEKGNPKLKWVSVGKHSEGIREINAHNLRNEQISKMKHGKDITVIATKKKKDSITLNDLANKYFEDKKKLNRNEKQNFRVNERENKYKNHIKQILGNKVITNITPEDVEKLKVSVLNKGLSNGTVNSVRELLSTIINHNIKIDYLKDYTNPCLKVGRLQADNIRERFLTTDEIKRLKDEVKDNFFVSLFVEFALSTGGRLETILHIQKKDIDLENKTVSLDNLKAKRRYTGFLQDDFIEILKEHLTQLGPNDYVVTQKGLQEKKADHKQIHRRLKPILDKLFNQGLKDDDITNRTVIHSLRHTFASHLAINGTPIYTIQKLMDHKDIKQTLRYAKLAPDSGKIHVQGLYR